MSKDLIQGTAKISVGKVQAVAGVSPVEARQKNTDGEKQLVGKIQESLAKLKQSRADKPQQP